MNLISEDKNLEDINNEVWQTIRKLKKSLKNNS